MVVSLNSFGRDFDGGLYVSTGSGREYIGKKKCAHNAPLMMAIGVNAGP